MARCARERQSLYNIMLSMFEIIHCMLFGALKAGNFGEIDNQARGGRVAIYLADRSTCNAAEIRRKICFLSRLGGVWGNVAMRLGIKPF